ncbi:MAG: NAD(P)H-dependent oxidoreductase [Halomonas sp.]|uniref:FMN dependent NADH:quinone oxidoreductase n=1 Tax=Billgrantia tianxiuensis TaxID=2497861 RepID=A0A6I6SL13_9GAMM|nr:MULTISPECIES: NAD(P)H-dependent oxidoreductase [Halomonas]MCE8033362.1 FMN-dependent NADH-azoreductase [Halomonas sp. MCCC 1A11057]MDX5435119.1 NAD(P)H-dependent oxidoreductase [Halomonas sp.]QHC49084.1 FMN-dependent NADH-azoreductase [Halomonas tianxiuensis]
MTIILHVSSSPRRQRSASLEAAHSFTTNFRGHIPDTQVKHLDLWDIELPEFDESAMAAKYAGLAGTPLTPAQQQAWDRLRQLASHLHEADLLLFSMPLWNFSIPYKLKHFIDLVSQKDILFSFDPESGFSGLLTGKKAIVVYARGLSYANDSFTPSQEYDYQKVYFEMWLKFVGIIDIESVIVEKTLFGSEIDGEARRHACLQAEQLAERLALSHQAARIPS